MTYASTNAANIVAPATGTLIGGGVGATTIPTQGGPIAVPSANTLLTFMPTPIGATFFVNPTPFYDAVFSAFTNNPSQGTIGPRDSSDEGGAAAPPFSRPDIAPPRAQDAPFDYAAASAAQSAPSPVMSEHTCGFSARMRPSTVEIAPTAGWRVP